MSSLGSSKSTPPSDHAANDNDRDNHDIEDDGIDGDDTDDQNNNHDADDHDSDDDDASEHSSDNGDANDAASDHLVTDSSITETAPLPPCVGAVGSSSADSAPHNTQGSTSGGFAGSSIGNDAVRSDSVPDDGKEEADDPGSIHSDASPSGDLLPDGSSLLGKVRAAELGPLARVVIIAISSTLPNPADAWEIVQRIESIKRDALVISQDSYKPGFLLQHEGLHMMFIYDLNSPGIFVRDLGQHKSRIELLTITKGTPTIILQKRGHLFTGPCTLRISWSWQPRGESQRLRTIDLRLLERKYEIESMRLNLGHRFSKPRRVLVVTTHAGSVAHPELAKNTAKDTYQLEFKDKLSDSHYSDVYQANHSGLGRIAVKIVKPKAGAGLLFESDNTKQIRWKREMEAMWPLDHPNLIKLIGCDSRTSSLHMPFLSFPRLSQLRPKHGVRFTGGGYSTMRRILKQMSSALEYLDGKKIIHNNIKPGNILYDAKARRPILLDFKEATKHGDPISHSGRCFYVPPEYYNAQSQRRGKEGDVFALGVVMLWLLGKIPLPERDQNTSTFEPEQAWLYPDGRHARRSSHWLQWIEKSRSKLIGQHGTRGVICKMLEPSPDQRISAGELKSLTRRH